MFERRRSAGKIVQLPVEDIHPSPYQARTTFDEQELAGLAQSIRENGLLQPISVRKTEDGYELVAGERRLRACKMAKMEQIPAVLCDFTDQRTAAMGLLENIQREDLNPFEQAQGLRDVMVLWDCTQAEAAKRLGMAQPTFANKLRLLTLTPEQQELCMVHHLSERHARAVLRLPESRRTAALEKIARDNMSVRQADKLVDTMLANPTSPSPCRKVTPMVRDVRFFVNTLQHAVDAGWLSPRRRAASACVQPHSRMTSLMPRAVSNGSSWLRCKFSSSPNAADSESSKSAKMAGIFSSPANRQARRRRSPATSWYLRSPTRRTLMGCSSPFCTMLTAKAAISFSSNTVRA